MKAVIRHMLVVVILLMVTISEGTVRAENADSDVHLLVYQFLQEDGTEIAPEQKVSEGDELVEPQVPEIENQAFDGWYLKNDDGSYERFTSFGTVGPVEQDATITLYARYTHQVYVLYYDLEDGTSFIIRPSGTEPKVKVYIMANGKEKAEVDAKIEKYAAAAKEIVK